MREFLRLIGFKNDIRAYAVPFETMEEVDRWFSPEFRIDEKGRRIAVGDPRMSRRERERYLVAEGRNLITNNGKSAIVGYLGTAGTLNDPFAPYLALGSGSISKVAGGDTTMPGEYFRQTPSSLIYTGSTQIDIQTLLTGMNGNGSITNIGLWGTSAASATLGTGSLYTHALFAYTKNTGSVYIDYIITIT